MEEEVKVQGNLDINQALKEFEIKSSIEQVQKTPANEEISDVPKIVQLTMKWFGVKEQRQAEYVLLGFVILAIIVSLFLVFGGGNKKTKFEAPPGRKIIYPENAPPRLEEQL